MDPSLLDLPDECLTNIITYLDYVSKEQAALVCRRFYEIVCHIDKDRNAIVLTNDQVRPMNYFLSFVFYLIFFKLYRLAMTKFSVQSYRASDVSAT